MVIVARLTETGGDSVTDRKTIVANIDITQEFIAKAEGTALTQVVRKIVQDLRDTAEASGYTVDTRERIHVRFLTKAGRP